MKLHKTVIALIICLISLNVYSANKFWIATSAGNWKTAANWSTGTVPGSGDVAIFNSSATGNCTIDTVANILGFSIVSGYTGTINISSNAVTIGATGASLGGGTFTGGSATITLNGTFTLSGTSFTSTSGTLICNSSVVNTSGTFTHNNGTVSFGGTGAQTIPAWNFYNLAITGSRTTSTVTLVNGGTIGIANTFTNSASFTLGGYANTGNTIEYKGTGTQTVIAFNYYNLTFSSTGVRTLASSGTIGISNTFTPGTNTCTSTGSTIDFNGTGTQTINAFAYYNNLTISGTRTANVILASSGTIVIGGAFTYSATFSSGSLVTTTSTISYSSSSAQTIITFPYYHLTITGARTTASVTLASSDTIRVAGTFTNSATFTTGNFINTSSTVRYNGTGAQTIAAFNYNNLVISGSHTGSITLANAGIIGINGAFTNTATFISGAFVNTNSSFNYNSTSAQTITASDYYNLYISGARGANNVTLSNTGIIRVAKVFNNYSTFSSGTFNNTSSTVEFNGTFPQSIPSINYNALTSSSTGVRSFASAGTIKISGTFTTGSNAYNSIGLNGEGYIPQYSGVSVGLLGIAAIDKNNVYMSGISGTVIKTINAGANWTTLPSTSVTTNDLYSTAFYSLDTGVAVGNTGTIIRTVNGGTSWTTSTSGTSQNLRFATFVNRNLGFATGGNGTILKTTDGGTTWVAKTSGTSQTIYSISFTTLLKGYACGATGTLLMTTDAGNTWSSVLTSGTTENLLSLKFVNTAIGIAVGTNGKIIRTRDAGATWTSISSGTADGFTGVDFIDINKGYITGGNVTNNTGTLMQTTDGGLTWTLINPGTTRLYGIDLVDATTGFLSAIDGNILSYSCCTNGSTVDFNGTGAQTIPALNFNNLIISGSRTTTSVTLASSGTIGIAGNFTKSATFTIGGMVTTSSTINLNGNQSQVVPVFTYNNLTSSGTGTKSLAGNVTVNGTLNMISAELALGANILNLNSSSYTALTRTKGYISSSGVGKFRRTTNSTNKYVFPIGTKAVNDSADYFVAGITPGLSSAQQFDLSLTSDNTGIVMVYDKNIYGSTASTILLELTTNSYYPLPLQLDINTSANISAVRVFDKTDNTLKTLPSGYYSISGGNQFTLTQVHQLAMIYDVGIMNSDMNWNYEIDYDGNGVPVKEQIQYYDLLGRPTQAQSRNITTNNILATQTIYDNYGRAALQTLPAPVGSVMVYQGNFVNNASATAYTYADFDKPTTSANLPGEINNSVAIQNTAVGTLGYYYSDNNTAEPTQATTSFPYSRKEMTAGQRTAAAGDEYKMGSGHESKTFTMISGDELRFIFGTNKSYKSGIDVSDKMVNSALTITGGIMAEKTLNRDADGKEVMTYNYNGLPIASCYTGIAGACTMTTVSNTMVYAGTSSTDIHLPGANKGSLKLVLPSYLDGVRTTVLASEINFQITDLATNTVLNPATDYSVNSSTRAVTFAGAYASSAISNVFRISFSFTAAKLAYFIAHSIVIPDATITYDLDYSRWGVNYYDLAGHLRKSVSPKGISCSSAGTITMATTYDYSRKGQLIASKSPDEGKKEITYDDEGKARFSQTAVQHAANTFSYINYDVHSRAVENGEYASSNTTGSSFFQNYYAAYSAPFLGNTATTSILNNIGNAGLLLADCSDISSILYYPLPSGGTEDIPSGYTYKSSYSGHYLMGHVCKTKNAQSATWYGYDQLGHTLFTVQQMLDIDYTGYNTTTDQQLKTMDYTYNLYNGTLTDQTYQKNVSAELLKHSFTYDPSLRLKQVDVTIGNGSPATQAKYYYSLTGALKRKELGDKLQGVDYIYTINGQLKSINNPSLDETEDPGQDGKTGAANSAFGKDVFGMTLDYHANDYQRNGTTIRSSNNGAGAGTSFYCGLLSATRYKTRGTTNSVNNGGDYIDYLGTNSQLIISGTTDEIMSQYSYDVQNRLSTVVWGKFANNTTTFTANSNSCYKEFSTSGGIVYDANGNITSLKRNAYNGTLGITMDDFTYTYISSTNQLASIVDVSTSTYTNDLDAATSKTFSYNGNGQMTADQAEGVSSITYYKSGLTKLVTYSNSNTAAYWYDDRGKKIKTKYYNASTAKAKFTWYIADAIGNPLAIYEYDQAASTPAFTLVDQPIYGSSRLGVLDKTTGIIEYELTDNLGNVRATIKGLGTTGAYQLTTRNDYYAFGGVMPGRSYNQGSYRYNYQGQESAVNSNWQMFELRMHNSDLGRWMAPDPMGQFNSPYISMGNNPVSGTDPNGGYTNGFVHPDPSTRGYSLKAYYEGPNDQYYGKYLDEEFYNEVTFQDNIKIYEKYLYNHTYGTDGSNPGLQKAKLDHGMFGLNQYDYHEMQKANGTAAIQLNILSNNDGFVVTTLSNNDGSASIISSTYDLYRDVQVGMEDGKEVEGTRKDNGIYYVDKNGTWKYVNFLGKSNKEATINEQANFISLGSTGTNSTVEDLLRYVMSMKPGTELSGAFIGTFSPKFSKASMAIKNVKKLDGGQAQVNLTWSGFLLVGASPDYGSLDGAIVNLSNYINNGVESVHVQSSTATYGGKPLNYYVNDNDYSIGGNIFGSLFHK